MPVTAEEPWRDLGILMADPAFLVPVEDPPCPVEHSRNMSKYDQESIRSGLLTSSKLIARSTKTKGCIVHIVT